MSALKRDTFISYLKANQKKFGIMYDYNVPNEWGKRVRGFKGIKTLIKTTADYGV